MKWVCTTIRDRNPSNFEIFVDDTEKDEDIYSGKTIEIETVRIKCINYKNKWIDWNNNHKHLAYYDSPGKFKIHWRNTEKSSFTLSRNGYYIYNSKQENDNSFYVKVGSDSSEYTVFTLE